MSLHLHPYLEPIENVRRNNCYLKLILLLLVLYQLKAKAIIGKRHEVFFHIKANFQSKYK